jgi:hypothetical protein
LNQNVFEFIEVLWVELDSTEERTDSLFRASLRKLDSDKFFYFWLFESGFIDDRLFDGDSLSLRLSDRFDYWRFDRGFDRCFDRCFGFSPTLLFPEKETGHD